MPRTSYVQIDGVLYEKGKEPERASSTTQKGPVTFGDQPDFVSPLDGKVYSGRAGMRDHNARHNVVSNRDLQGLPALTMTSDQRTSEQKRESAAQRKQTIINQVNRHYR
jgi:hypothetical protein